MASLSKEKGGIHRIHWRFKIRVGPRAGEMIRGSLQLGRCTRAVARTKLREIDEWEERVKTGRHVPDRDFDDVSAAWYRERELTCTPQTMDRTKRVIDLYQRWRKERGLPCSTVADVANRNDLIAWRDQRLDGEVGRKTVANDFSTLSAFFDWCVREKYLPDNPMERIARPRFVAHKEGTPLTRGQAGRWLRSIRPRQGRNGRGPRSWEDVRRKRRLIVFFLNTGLRNGEVCSLNVEDLRVDDEAQLIHVMGKGLKRRWVPLNRAALATIHLTLRDRGHPKNGPLFTTMAGDRYNVRQLAGEVVKTANGLDEPIDCNPHNLRHSFATWMVRSTSNVAMVQKVLGHENVNTTLKYYIHTGDHELAGATAGLHGRRNEEKAGMPKRNDDFRIIKFPQRQVS